MTRSVARAFRAQTGRDPDGTWSAPGRVNLIGEHTDYNDGFVLPFALPLRTEVAAGRRQDGLLRINSCQYPGESTVVPIDALTPLRPGGWSAYVAGVAWSLRAAGHSISGLDLVVDGQVPRGSGLSSSAAIECATALAVASVYDLDLGPVQLARHAQRAENEFVGVPCGLMDQMVSMCARAGEAMLFDARSGATEHIEFDPPGAGLRLCVIDTRSSHEHAGGAYAIRRQECATAADRLGVPALRDIPPEGLEDALRSLAETPVLARRIRHVVTENARTLQAADLLRAGRMDEIGPLLTASHRSLRDDFEVSTPELDLAVEAACAAGALGARLTGGGFGGCAIALVPEEQVTAVTEAVTTSFRQANLPFPTVTTAEPSGGARQDPERAHGHE
jgi:galactokinase